MLSFGKNFYCTFIDFKKAFDTVWRLGLWQKLVKNQVTGKILRVIFNMYDNIKSCVKKGNDISGFFSSDLGVRQGENVSPFLFSIFLSDLEEFLCENNINGLETVSTHCQEHIGLYLQIFILFYADDTIILAETASDMQNTLDMFELYCTQWKLSVNTDKTKIMIFSKRKSKRNHLHVFKLYGSDIEIVDFYPYLGLLFNCNGRFTNARIKLIEQAEKALYALYRKIRNLNIPIDLQIKVFDSLVEPY